MTLEMHPLSHESRSSYSAGGAQQKIPKVLCKGKEVLCQVESLVTVQRWGEGLFGWPLDQQEN